MVGYRRPVGNRCRYVSLCWCSSSSILISGQFQIIIANSLLVFRSTAAQECTRNCTIHTHPKTKCFGGLHIEMTPEEDSTAAKNLAGPSQVAESGLTSLIIPSTSAADNQRPLSAAQSRDIVTAIPTTHTSSKMVLQDMNINFPMNVLSPVKGIYVDGQEEAKAKSALRPVRKKNLRKVTKALHFSSYSENDLSFFFETGNDDEDCPCICCNDQNSRSKPKEVWLKCLSCKRWAHASCADVSKKTKRLTLELGM
ncbi:hypothetical protein WA026_018165 [Henosepilachna vigintioctopunctata]|uniref:Zinc finger PHD-type domain-containing protein n=1 Tax=Henosepilachna vigintioctopunctata TaxID=420089 RepID=A0AAW1UMD1_9CUCU